MPRNPHRELLTINAVAKRLGFDWARVKRLAESGELPGVRLGGRLYIRNLTAFLDQVQTKPATGSSREAVSRQAREDEEARRLGLPPGLDFEEAAELILKAR